MPYTKRLLLIVPLFLLVLSAVAQERTVVGTVLSEKDDEPVLNATVLNRNTKKSTTTSSNGRFVIKAKKGDVLEISSIGQMKTTVTVGDGNDLMVRMAVNEQQLKEVVVTALGIKKDKRSLGTSQQDIRGDDVAETQRENFFNAIQSRVAGATVTSTSGAPGASSQVVLRGFNSISGSNSPLIVVDGLPLNNEVFNQHRLASDLDNRNNDFTNRAADINPDDIESITVLKGPEAAALYGTEAGSGAIIITTKKGRAQPLKLSYENNFRFEKITRYHKVQRVFDLGTNAAPSSLVRGFFGPRYAPGTVLYNNMENFFETGNTQKHTLFAEGGNKLITYRWSGTFSDQHGIIPNTQYRRLNTRLTISSKLRKDLDLTATGTYANNLNKKAFRGLSGYMLNLLFWPLDDDASNYLNSSGGRRIVSKLSSGADNYAEANNAYFDVNKNINFDKVNRGTVNIQLNYDPLEWLNIAVKGAADKYWQEGGYMLHPESSTVYTIGGRMEQYTQNFTSYSGTFLVTTRKKIGAVGVKLLTGAAIDDRKTEIYSRRGDSIINADKVTYKNLSVDQFTSTTPSKRVTSRTTGRDTLVLERSLGLFGELSFDYKDMLYLNITGRNDWLAEFPADNRSYFYPSANLSFIFSELWGESASVPYAKYRVSVAQTGKRVAPYRNQSVYTPLISATNTYGILYGFDNNNPNLQPERQTTIETGLEMNFVNNRFGFDLTYYNTYVDKQVVVGARASYGTGFVLNTINAASVRNQGVEGIFRMHLIKKKNFNWRLNVNTSKMWNRVVGLPASLPEFYNSDTWLAGFRASLFINQPTTTIGGIDYQRNNAGQILIDASGYPMIHATYYKIGDRNPDIVFGIQNRFNYKNFNLSFLLDLKLGGDVLNATELWMTQMGLSVRTLDREVPRIFPGVMADGLQNTANPTPNTVLITPAYQNFLYTDRSIAVDFVEHDVNWLRMRDVTFSYNFGKRLLSSLRFLQNGSLFVTGTDLFIITNYTGVDPAVNGNTPSTGGVGSFAIDYGNTATPIGVNFGLKVTFKQKK